MAWIKLEHHTPRKPEVLRTAAALRITPAEAFLAIFDLWCWADVNGIKGKVDNIDYATINAMQGRAGLCEAMEAQGWIRQTENGVAFPAWDKHNGESAKQRANAARRASRFRNAGRVTRVTKQALPTRPDQTRPDQTGDKTSLPTGPRPAGGSNGQAGALREPGREHDGVREYLVKVDVRNPWRDAIVSAGCSLELAGEVYRSVKADPKVRKRGSVVGYRLCERLGLPTDQRELESLHPTGAHTP